MPTEQPQSTERKDFEWVKKLPKVLAYPIIEFLYPMFLQIPKPGKGKVEPAAVNHVYQEVEIHSMMQFLRTIIWTWVATQVKDASMQTLNAKSIAFAIALAFTLENIVDSGLTVSRGIHAIRKTKLAAAKEEVKKLSR